jgi:hypothetical protein
MRHLLYGLAAGCALWIGAGPAAANGPYAGGCSDCDGGCKPSFFDRFKTSSFGCNAGCGGCKSNWLKDWLSRPCPSGAPTLRQDYPLGFKTHPYARSPRDWFMDP